MFFKEPIKVSQTKEWFFSRWWFSVEPQSRLRNHLRTLTVSVAPRIPEPLGLLHQVAVLCPPSSPTALTVTMATRDQTRGHLSEAVAVHESGWECESPRALHWPPPLWSQDAMDEYGRLKNLKKVRAGRRGGGEAMGRRGVGSVVTLSLSAGPRLPGEEEEV